MKIVQFRRKLKLGKVLTNYSGIYAVQSELGDVIYGVSDGLFAILTSEGAVYTDFADTPNMAAKMIPPVRDEILGVYQDVLEYGINHNLMGVYG